MTAAVPTRPSGFLAALLRNRKFVAGAGIFLLIAVVALVGSLTVDPRLRGAGRFPPRQPPGTAAILGTDTLGRSIAVQMTQAVPNSLQVGLIAALIGTLLGAAIGFISGYFSGIVDALLRILIDVFLSVPSLLFLILIAALVAVSACGPWPSSSASSPGPRPPGRCAPRSSASKSVPLSKSPVSPG